MKKLTLQVLSDLHLEVPLAPKRFKSEYDIKKLSKILILAGDIGSPFKNSLEKYLEEVSKKYELVLYVAGNHEFYKGEYYQILNTLEKLCGKWDNVYFLNETSLVRDGVRFVGCTLWTSVPKEKVIEVSKTMTEYERVAIISKNPSDEKKKRRLMVEDTMKFHEDHVSFIKREMELAKKNREKVVVITHHSPNLQTKRKHFDSDGSHECHHGYASDLRELFEPPIITWIHGHTHISRKNVLINGIPCVSNQLGYVTFRQKTEFDPKYILVLETNEKNKTTSEEEDEGEED